MRHRFTQGPARRRRSSCCSAGRRRSRRSRTTSAASSYNVGIVYSRTGLLAAYGAEYVEGLKLGLQYATNGTNKVNGKTINLTSSTTRPIPRRPSRRRRT